MSCLSLPRTQSTPLPAPDQTQPPTTMPKTMKNVCAKSKPERKSSKAKKSKQPLQQTAMMQSNPKYVKGQPMLTADQLCEADQYCVKLHKYYIKNSNTCQDIIVPFKDRHFLLGDGIFVITFSNLYDLFTLDTLDISLMHCFTL
jgi:hypothetical protein